MDNYKDINTLKGYKWIVKNNILEYPLTDSNNIAAQILTNRNILNIGDFYDPKHPIETLKNFTDLYEDCQLAAGLIKKAITEKKLIIIHGDYDVDGQTASAILWRAIYYGLNYKRVIPFIPNRFTDGYGLTNKSVENIESIINENGAKCKDTLVITVDCGIVSHDQFSRLKKKGIATILTDHHHQDKTLPQADHIVWSDKLTGAGIAYFIAEFLVGKKISEDHNLLLLAAIGTICDLQPLLSLNRSIVKYGLKQKIRNIGLLNLKKVCNLEVDLNASNIGWIIGPCLNASGRLDSALEGLRLLCSINSKEAKTLAEQVYSLNKNRQDLTNDAIKKAMSYISDHDLPSIIVYTGENINEGIIGLIAGKVCEQFDRPTVVFNLNDKTGIAKGSARSLNDINITNILKEKQNLFISVGGHKQAAGCSLAINKLENLIRYLESVEISEDQLTKHIKIDIHIKQEQIRIDTIRALEQLQPFGIGNPKPIFLIDEFIISRVFFMGKNKNHAKLVSTKDNSAIIFNVTEKEKKTLSKISGESAVLIGNLSINEWQGNLSPQILIKDILF